ncbi:M4 family metallopeptidase [Streptomyces sp. RKAG337]|uniref:M4 family metallopeptidase n=1 Tax=Streptomyces sp. RKAG337 TaxID=2893404 RepID=UPI0020332EC2|nr:M4 family metallopeptidase [Streptomyces sp. RKAG337]MCM2424898.1 M4 family metallopeptidase [Streptomyces sp. RKAG337]
MSRPRILSKSSLTTAAALAALIGVGFQTGSATAQTEDNGRSAQAKTFATPSAAAQPVTVSAAQRGALLAAASGNSAATARSLHLGAQEKLIASDVTKDANGTVHTRYQRTYAGLPVLGGDLVVHADASGATIGVDKANNAAIAVATTTAARLAPAAGARQVVWAGKGTPALAWETVTKGLQHDGTPSELHVITDARTGAKLFQYQGIETGTGTSEYSGTVTIGTTAAGATFTMADATRGGHKTYDLKHGTSGTGTLFTKSTDAWGDGTVANAETAGVDAAYGAQETWDFYKTVMGRNGIRNDGVGAYSRTHYGSSYSNAFWDDGCFCMTYGDGAGDKKPLTALDVAGHEMSHGVTAATAKLEYSGESGGLNEATSDIMGTSVEFYANNAKNPGNYLIGEQLDLNGDGTPLRYQDKPSRDGTSPDAWSADVGGLDVHYSSGPANHFFYLLSEGSGAKTINGVTYDSPTSDNKPVAGIGRDNASKVWYKALSTYMTSSTDYAGARVATLKAATDLFGAGSASYNTVANAWAAVNVGARVS